MKDDQGVIYDSDEGAQPADIQSSRGQEFRSLLLDDHNIFDDDEEKSLLLFTLSIGKYYPTL